MRDIKYIVIHTAETPVLNEEGHNVDDRFGAEDIRKWHTNKPPLGNGWSDIGYHFVVRRTGEIEGGRHISEIGAHVQGYNENSIGICWIGGAVDIDGKRHRVNNMNWQQKTRMRANIQTLKLQFPNAEVVGHRDLDPSKECPLFDVKKEFPGL